MRRAAAAIDGVFAAGSSIDLTQGQEMLVWVSCSYFDMPDETTYTLTIFEQ